MERQLNSRNGLRIILHLIPLSAFASHQRLPVQDYRDLHLQLWPVAGGKTVDYHLNFDGLVVASGTNRNVFHAYTQFFRSGVLEFVRVYEAGDEKYLPSASYEKELLKSYSAGIDALKKLFIHRPLIVIVTLANAKGYRLGIGSIAHLFTSEPIPFDRDVMLIPDVEIESLDQEILMCLGQYLTSSGTPEAMSAPCGSTKTTIRNQLANVRKGPSASACCLIIIISPSLEHQ